MDDSILWQIILFYFFLIFVYLQHYQVAIFSHNTRVKMYVLPKCKKKIIQYISAIHTHLPVYFKNTENTETYLLRANF